MQKIVNTKKMKILGVDPGTSQTGWVLYNTITHSIEDSGVTENEEFLNSVIETQDYDIIAIERIASYGMPIGTDTIRTIEYIGRYWQKVLDSKKNVRVELFYKKVDINPSICGSNKAKDANIRQAIIDMFPKTGGGSNPAVGTSKQPGALYGISTHKWAALAVALTCAIKNKLIEVKIY